jgi:hypothetical protein
VQTEQAKDQGSSLAGKTQDHAGSMGDTLGKKADEAKGAAKDTVRMHSALVLVHSCTKARLFLC